MGTVYIYALSDPASGDVRYVGQSRDPAARLILHLAPSNLKKRTRKTSWLKSLLGRGCRPVLTILEVSDERSWPEAERRQIAAHKAAGCRLVNGTAGGDGLPGFKHSALTRARMSASHTGRKRAPDAVAKVVAFHTGRKRSALTCARIGAALQGKKLAPAHRDKLSASTRGRPKSAEHRAKISVAAKGNTANVGRRFSPEHRAKIAAALTGKPKSAEARARMSAAAKARCARHGRQSEPAAGLVDRGD